MIARFYQMKCEKNKVVKDVLTDLEIVLNKDVIPRMPFSITDPVLDLDVRGWLDGTTPQKDLPHFNYVELVIPDQTDPEGATRNAFKEYFVTDVTCISAGLYRVTCHEDVLNTFSTEILALDAIVARQENETDTNIPDPAMVYDDDIDVQVKDFNFGFGEQFDAWGTEHQGESPSITALSGGSVVVSVLSNSVPPTTPQTIDSHDLNQHDANVPAFMPVAPQTRLYAMPILESRYMVDALYNGTFIDNIKRLLTEPADFINSIRLYPFRVWNLYPVGREPTISPIQIFDQTLSGGGSIQYRLDYAPDLLDLGYYSVTPVGDYTDYPPYTEISLFLPYIGFVDLDVDEVMGQDVHVRYAVDLYTGDCTAYVSVGLAASGHIIMQRKGTVGVEFQFGGGRLNEQLKTLLSSTFGIVSGAVTAAANPGLGAMQIGGTVMNSVTSLSHAKMTRGGSVDSYLSLYSPQRPFLIIKRKKKHMPDNYEKYIGKICNKELSLSSLSGFTQIGDVHLSGFPTATSAELDEIERLLKSGVIF